MTWARALGEFGATIIFAGNFPGRTQTMPLAIYIGFELDLNIALTLSAVLLAIAFAVLLLVLAEIQGLPEPALHGAGIVLVVSRVVHAVGLSQKPGYSSGRFYGTGGTWIVIAGLSLWLLWATTAASRFPAPG